MQTEFGVSSACSRWPGPKNSHRTIAWDGLEAAALSASGGHCTPEAVVQGYARGARSHGAVLRQHCAVTGIGISGGRIDEMRTDRGPVRTSTVATSFYFHGDVPGLLIGMSDPDEDFGFHLNTEDRWLFRLSGAIVHRAPALSDVGIAHGGVGLCGVTPDHNPLIGAAEAVPGFVCVTGFPGHGFLQSPAAGEVMRDRVLGDRPFVDVSGFRADRFTATAARPELNCI